MVPQEPPFEFTAPDDFTAGNQTWRRGFVCYGYQPDFGAGYGLLHDLPVLTAQVPRLCLCVARAIVGFLKKKSNRGLVPHLLPGGR
jgi:hypothetical protein